MAKNLIVELTDDIDGSVIADGTGESIEFSVDGVDYAIDLKAKNAEKFRKTLGYYIEHAAKVGGRKRGGHTSAVRAAAKAATGKSAKRDPEQTRAIREWANGNGYEVSDRGRIPTAVVEAFDAAH
ncbi:histone-like nucleoid-structuring protein Lsr2 [Rhodococcus sp. UNC23MFCrub1.1]|uniref:histone-like nucleoid-structuring protein Lsr2 n=1 Tax=Rhodococcus sp. UNC23MFCrub1.1 TaxID=1449068 RepID=UPI00048789BE|nr:Lsr2 family protein [Rhodococcus sp. UNC23MFCrub1.1]